VAEAAQVSVKKHTLDLAVGHAEQQGRGRSITVVEHDRGLAVELVLCQLESRRAALGRRDHESRHARRA